MPITNTPPQIDGLLGKVDFTEIFSRVLASYGLEGLVIIVLLFSGLAFAFAWTRTLGWWSSGTNKMIDRVLESQHTAMRESSNSMERMIDLIGQSIRNQESKLTTDQIDDILDGKFSIFRYRFIESLVDIYRINNIVGRKPEIVKKIRERFSTIIHEEDLKIFKLPGMAGAVIDSSLKMKTFEDDDVYGRLYDVMINHPSSNPSEERQMFRDSTDIIRGVISLKWRLR